MLDQWANISSLGMFFLTIILVAIVMYEEYYKPNFQIPVKVDPLSLRELEEEEKFSVHVKNRTGNRISGGSRFVILPRDFKIDCMDVDLYRFQPNAVTNFLMGDSEALDEGFVSGCPMYCEAPAGLDPKTWRGLWATYLDPVGGDRRKRLSTTPAPFPVYQSQVNNVIQQARNELLERHDDEEMEDGKVAKKVENILQKRVTKVMETYEQQVRKNTEEYSEPEELMDCIFPAHEDLMDIDGATTIEFELSNIGKFEFIQDGYGSWTRIDRGKF